MKEARAPRQPTFASFDGAGAGQDRARNDPEDMVGVGRKRVLIRYPRKRANEREQTPRCKSFRPRRRRSKMW